ncbi:hypothetical protein [Spirillospora sp. NPDC048819]|uniref:hypothetical protein n=1 Tax=Spirillospora sp. NPDC048819 TaxID=3155268 RepID=UPI00340A7C89
MTSPSFTPQPYPLFAATFDVADNLARFVPTIVPVHLVLGWTHQDGQLRPVLDGSPELTIWTGAINYSETREQAETMVKAIEKAARGEIRRHEISQLLRKLTGAKDEEDTSKAG